MHRIVFFVALALLSVSCSDEADRTEAASRKTGYGDVPKTKADSLYHEVMEGHDVGMAKIGKLRRYSAQVQQKLDSLGNAGNRANKAELAAFQQLQKDLHDADSSMNQWMEDFFKGDSASANKPEQRISFLQSEKEKVTQVKEAILGSLQRADSLFAVKK